MSERISYAVILTAKCGNAEAMRTILWHYAPYIRHCATRTAYDRFGNAHYFLDEDVRQTIEATLMLQIVYHFDPYRLPEGEQLEEME